MSAQHSNTAEVHSGNVYYAAAASSAIQPIVSYPQSDANSATGKKGDGNSAKSIPQKSDARLQSDAGTAKPNAAGKSDGIGSAKVPSMCRHRPNQLISNPLKLMPFPAPHTKRFSRRKKISSPPRHTGNRTRYGKT
jgi:hypothetical protein